MKGETNSKKKHKIGGRRM